MLEVDGDGNATYLVAVLLIVSFGFGGRFFLIVFFFEMSYTVVMVDATVNLSERL